MVELLLANGAAVDAVQLQGWTPLHAAASRGRLEVVRVLLDHGRMWTRRMTRAGRRSI